MSKQNITLLSAQKLSKISKYNEAQILSALYSSKVDKETILTVVSEILTSLDSIDTSNHEGPRKTKRSTKKRTKKEILRLVDFIMYWLFNLLIVGLFIDFIIW
jgi:SOS response regulatory protein OraA/RecX